MNANPGTLATDILTEDAVYIISVGGDPINEQVADYDYNKNPITVYDMEKDKDYDCNPDEPVVTVAYPERIRELFDTTDVPVSDVQEKVEAKKIKPYYFPPSRLKA